MSYDRSITTMLSNDGDGKRRLITNSCLLLRATSIFFGRSLNRNKLNRPASAICILSLKLIDTFQMKANEKIRENKNACVRVYVCEKEKEREREKKSIYSAKRHIRS